MIECLSTRRERRVDLLMVQNYIDSQFVVFTSKKNIL
jgi:hypothetical protein